MTQLLEKAFKEAAELPDLEQNVFAHWVLEELNAEKKWDATFSSSEDLFEKMADKALSEHKKRKTVPLNPDKL